MNYIDLARRTAAPTGPVLHRIHVNREILAWLFQLTTTLIPLLETLDAFKRCLFYGKGCPADGHASASAPGLTTPLNNAVAAFEEQPELLIELLHGIVGHATESGELLAAIHAVLFEGKDLDRTNVLEELGDSQWYVANTLFALDTTFEALQAANVAKLAARYPAKFTEEHAINRNLSAERAALSIGAGDGEIKSNGCFVPSPDDILAGLRNYLDGLTINSESIGGIRARLTLPFACSWNAVVRDETARRERNAGDMNLAAAAAGATTITTAVAVGASIQKPATS